MTQPASVDAYLANVPQPSRATLESLRATIRAAAPESVEGIGYGIPSYKYRGRPLAYFGAAKNHCALYGLDTSVAEEAGFDTSQKGTIRFRPDAPPPESLVKQLLSLRIAAIDGELAKKPGKSVPKPAS